MASIINSISFKNFFNYYGDYDDNRYELKEGVNVIVATNGGGKSKFFNAFLWLFNDTFLDSDDKIVKSIKNEFVKVACDKAKAETDIRGQVECGIKIEYTFGTRYRYEIEKSFIATRISEDLTNKNSWQLTPIDIAVNRTELVLTKYKPVYDEDEKRRVINQLIMPNFRKYSFLQGEEVDNIIDFTEKSSIEDAVKDLTDIKKYEDLVKAIDYIKERAQKDLDSISKASSSQNKRMEDALQEKRNISNNLSNEQKKLKEYEQTFIDAESEKNELDKMYSNAEKRKALDDKLRIANKKVKAVEEEYNEFLERINSRFFDGNFAWISMGFDNVVEKFRAMNDHFNAERYKKKALMDVEEDPNNYFHFMPLDSPDYISIQNMIKHEHCFVCDRPAKKGTNSYDYLIQLRDRPKKEKSTKEFVKNDLKHFFGNLQINAQPFYNKIESIKSSVGNTRLKEQELNKKLNKFKEDVKSLKDQRKDILVAGSDSENTPSEIISHYQGAIRRMENARTKIEDIYKPKIKKLQNDISNLENEIEGLSRNQGIPNSYIDNFSIAKDILDATIKAKERVYDEMIKLLENHANKHFKKLIFKNKIAGGILKFEKTPSGSIDLNYIDSKNNFVTGSSEGFQRMKKFSVVMAIITANKSDYNYPLLADAPISAFGEAFTEGFFEATGTVFPQSIILVKELYDGKDDMKINDLGRRVLADSNVSTMYVNEVKPENEEQINRITTKIKLK